MDAFKRVGLRGKTASDAFRGGWITREQFAGRAGAPKFEGLLCARADACTIRNTQKPEQFAIAHVSETVACRYLDGVCSRISLSTVTKEQPRSLQFCLPPGPGRRCCRGSVLMNFQFCVSTLQVMSAAGDRLQKRPVAS